MDAAAVHLIEALRLTGDLGSHELTLPLLTVAEVFRHRNDLDGAALALRIAHRNWPYDEGWFRLACRFIARDTAGLDALPVSHRPLPSTVRKQVQWAIDRLSPPA